MIYGRLDPYFETGTEGVLWSVADCGLPGYDGLWILRDGDELKVIGLYDETLWSGVIALEYQRNWQPYPMNPECGQQAVRGFWVHGLQTNFDPNAWADMFSRRYRAELTLGPAQTPRDHPFEGPLMTLGERLRAVPQPDELFRTALYPWLNFYGDGGYSSYALAWKFSFDEIVQLIGSPNEAQIAAWKSYPKHAHDMLMPFDWSLFERLALLFRIYGALNRKYHHAGDAAAWLLAMDRKALLLGDIVGIRQVAAMLNPDV